MKPNCFVVFMRQPGVVIRGDRGKAQENKFFIFTEPRDKKQAGPLRKNTRMNRSRSRNQGKAQATAFIGISAEQARQGKAG